jgi:GR25 family glycosyltransferase involved in LPS biosynthesis
MSGNEEEDKAEGHKAEGGSYVPPHRRSEADAGRPQGPGRNKSGDFPRNNNNENRNKFPPRSKSHGNEFHKGNNNNNNNKFPPRNNSKNKNNNNNQNNNDHKKNNNNQNQFQHFRRPGRGGGRGDNRNRNNSNNHNHNHDRGGDRSHSRGRSNKSRSNSPNKYHHMHLTKEQIHHQKEQLHLLTDAVKRICCINLERRPDRWASFQLHLHQSLGKKMGHSLSNKIEKYNAVDGLGNYADELPQLVQTSWDATINARWDRHISPPMTKEMSAGEVGCALSHIQLWKELIEMKIETPPPEENVTAPATTISSSSALIQPTMMILEDDALFYSPKLAMNKKAIREELNPHGGPQPVAPLTYNHDFLTAFQLAWTQLPEDWDIWYLGFSDRGDRLPVEKDFHLPKHHHHDHNHPTMTVQLFRPTYGFHTHGYVLTAKAAQKLLDNLPVVGPLDVWLADNEWFGMKVYCSVVEGEGWHETGAWLITQNRKANSNIPASGRDQDKEQEKLKEEEAKEKEDGTQDEGEEES